MDGNGDKKPSVRKLTVDNFSVIKHAELEFGKITVLIGPQASGKSLLCKLAFFLEKAVFDIAIDRIVNRFEFKDFEVAAREEFVRWFHPGGWGAGGFSIVISSADFFVSVSASEGAKTAADLALTFPDRFQDEYVRLLKQMEDEGKRWGFSPPVDVVRSLSATALLSIAGKGIWDYSSYIPSERAYFLDTQKGYRAMGAELDPISTSFAIQFADSLRRDLPDRRVPRFLGGTLEKLPNGLWIAFDDGRLVPLEHLSEGGKELFPLLSILDTYERARKGSGESFKREELHGRRLYAFDDFKIEEPESSIFPRTQYELAKEIAAMANSSDLDTRFTITTHSPYILSAFNNLIFAGQLGQDKRLKKKIKIDEKYWIEPGTFKAYSIHDGKLESILSESGLINGEYLDSVSEAIGKEFDELLRLEYGKKKAS